MNDSTTSALRQVLTAGGAVLAGLGITNLESATTLANDFAVAIPALISIASIIWSIVAHYGKKKVPVEATALILPKDLPPVLKPVVGSTIDLGPLTGTAKVVG